MISALSSILQNFENLNSEPMNLPGLENLDQEGREMGKGLTGMQD
jgi:hypothetical protein